MALISKI